MTAAVRDDQCATAVRKGRPRDARIDDQVTSAALEALAEGGFEGLCVEDVAQRAGVAKTTVYRRFPTRDDLIAGTLERLNDDLPSAPPPGPVRDRLVGLLSDIRRRTPGSVRGRILMHAAAAGQREPDLAELVQARVLAPRRRVIRDVIADAIASGEVRDDVDVDAVIPVLVGSMIYLGMWDMTSVAQDVTVESTVDTILRGMTPATDS